MNASVGSPWEAVRTLTPASVAGVQYLDRWVRGELWTFVHSDLSGQHVRINALARQLVHRIDGRTSVERLLQTLEIDVDAQAREALASSLQSLSLLGLISLNSPAAESRLQDRAASSGRVSAASWLNPLAIRIPLLDPDLLLARMERHTRGVSGRLVLRAVMAILLAALFSALFHTRELTAQLLDLARTPQQWWSLLIVYPFLKCVHEAAHGLVLKRFGGSVHEMGISVLILMPLPYVDASDSWQIESRRQRILVSAAGMLAEGLCAAIGYFIWLTVEPGLVHEMGFALALAGSVSTLLFNANPLLKFDGYHILQDLLDIPNLASRSSRYLRFLLRRHLLRVDTARSPVTGIGERRWLLSYGLAAAAYRWFITMGIALYLSTSIPFLGITLALFALYPLAVKPLLQSTTYLLYAEELQACRPKALLLAGSVLSVLLALVFFLPVPTSTRAQGVVAVSSQARLYAPESGEITRLHVSEGQHVAVGERILSLGAPELQTQLAVLQSEMAVLAIQYQAALVRNPAASGALLQDIETRRQAVSNLHRRIEALELRSGADGTVSLDRQLVRVGQFVQAGAGLGHLVSSAGLQVQAVVPQSAIARVEEGVQAVHIRLAERFSAPFAGTLVQQTPTGNRVLPSQALVDQGPGGIAVASTDDNQWETVEPVFHLELQLPPGVSTAGIGGRAYITLSHQAESLGHRGWRALRQLLLDRLAV